MGPLTEETNLNLEKIIEKQRPFKNDVSYKFIN